MIVSCGSHTIAQRSSIFNATERVQVISHPWLLLIGLAPPALLILQLSIRRRDGAVDLSGFEWISGAGKMRPSVAPAIFRAAALVCLAPVVAGLQPAEVRKPVPPPEALVIVLDVSSSMTAADFTPVDRLQAARLRLKEFVLRHPELELGLIQLAASPRLLVPVTSEHEAVLRALDGIEPAGYGEDGTAIGSGVASAVNRLRGGPWGKRRVLLVTDGVNNRGPVAPLDAARAARALGVSVDAVGIGTNRISRFWAPSENGPAAEVRARIEIDDKALQELAEETGGSYRRVRSSGELADALAALGPGSENTVPAVEAAPDFRRIQLPALAALVLLCVELLLSQIVLSELPG